MRYNFIFLLFPLIASICLNSCSDGFFDSSDEDEYSYTYKCIMNCVPPEFSNISTRSATDWEDGSTVYITFTPTISGKAVYDKKTANWVMSVNSSVLESGSCSGRYFDGQMNNNIVTSALTSVFEGDGTFSSHNQVVTVSITLRPKYSRIRFKGNPGSKFTITSEDFSHQKDFGNSGSYEKLSEDLAVDASGYTPYIYGLFNASNKKNKLDITLDGASYTKEIDCTKLSVGESGVITLPQSGELHGWTKSESIKCDVPCFLYVPSKDAFISRGADWGTRITLDRYGICIKIKSVNHEYSLLCVDDIYDRFIGEDVYPYADKDTNYPINWTFETADNGEYLMRISSGKYLTDDGINKGCSFTSDKSRATHVRLVYAEEYNKILNSRTSISSEIPVNYIEVDVTDKIKNPTMSENYDNWTSTFWATAGTMTSRAGLTEVYQQIGELYQDITGLEPAIYKFTLEGFYRGSSNQRCATYDNLGISLGNAYIFANGEQGRIVPWASARKDNTYPNTMEEAYTLISQNKYKNEVYCRVGNAGVLRIGIALPQYVSNSWLIWRNARLYKYVADKSSHEYVDLGLSVKWATCNIGASKPEEFGDYFAWGETTGYNDGKKSFNWDTYKWYKNSAYTKYCTDASYGIVDDKSVLELEDDVAHVEWGANWRLPSYAEFSELISKCKWTWDVKNGINGYMITSEVNGNSIFLPTAGHYTSEGLGNVGLNGYYWTNSIQVTPSNAVGLYFNSNTIGHLTSSRCQGNSVRAVCP